MKPEIYNAPFCQATTHFAHASAEQWDFALKNEKLYETQMTISGLRWLVARKFVKHDRLFRNGVQGRPF
jgi:hypothetical protein